MKAEEIQAGRLFESSQQLLIPLWQRHFSWDRREWSELWTDIQRVGNQDLASHFLGSVVLKTLPWRGLPSEAKRYWVVDGQQRVTTLTILVCAIRDRIAQLAGSKAERDELLTTYTSQLLKNTNLQEDHQDRLVLQDRDRVTLAPIVERTWDGSTLSLVERAYAYFKGEVSALNHEQLLDLLSLVQTRLTAVWVTLEAGDNAHRVFQTLNAGGKRLRQSDLVRNYFFLLLAEAGDAFYAAHWRQMEADLSDKDLEDYLVAWSISQGYSGGRDSLFQYFHRDLLPHESSIDEILNYGRALTATARLFRWIRQPTDSTLPVDVQGTMVDLRNWTTLPAEGLILWLLRKHEESILASAELRDALEIVLSFMARRQLAGYEPNLHKSIFVAATRRLSAAEGLSGSDIVEYLRFLLSKGDDVRTWPTNETVVANARTSQIYSAARSNWTFSILERINRQFFTAQQHAPQALDRSRFSVEHVMPQTLTEEWMADLAEWGVENPTQLHQSRLHSLGNLTLTPINSALSNLRFAQKHALLSDDSLRLNVQIADAQTWSEHRINERSSALAQLACQAYTAPLSGDALEEAKLRFGSVEEPDSDDTDELMSDDYAGDDE